MGAVENPQTVERLFQALNERDVEMFHAQFHEDSVIEFPSPASASLATRTAGRCTGRSLDGRG